MHQNTHTLVVLALLILLSTPCTWGQQLELAKTNRGVKSQVIAHTGYTVSYNQEWRIPNWVAWELLAQETSGDARRKGIQFQRDPEVHGKSASTYDYSQSGYDRGHMAPAGDMKWDIHAMEECFYLSNICPQNREMNGGAWQNLETRCRGWAKQNGCVWICCGPIVDCHHPTIGQNKVAVPSGFFKVICMLRKGRYYAIGFVMPNSSEPTSIWDYACTVDEVEQLTGHDFFFELPDHVEEYIEQVLELKVWQYN